MAEEIGKRILVIEDEPLLGNLLKRRLEKEGFGVVLARDGDEAISVLRGSSFALAMLDVILPKRSGFEILELVNKDPELSAKNIPFIVISNLGQENDVERAASLGAVGYFVKAQLSFEELVTQVKDFLQQKN